MVVYLVPVGYHDQMPNTGLNDQCTDKSPTAHFINSVTNITVLTRSVRYSSRRCYARYSAHHVWRCRVGRGRAVHHEVEAEVADEDLARNAAVQHDHLTRRHVPGAGAGTAVHVTGHQTYSSTDRGSIICCPREGSVRAGRQTTGMVCVDCATIPNSTGLSSSHLQFLLSCSQGYI